MLTTPLRSARLLARRGDRRLWVLDTPAYTLWDLHRAGHDPHQLAALIGEAYGLSVATARAQVDQLLVDWRQSGLLAATPAPPAAYRLGDAAEPIPPAPRPRQAPPGYQVVRVADRRVGLAVAIPDCRSCVEAWFQAPPTTTGHEGLVDHALRLTGTPCDWRLWLDDTLHAQGRTRDTALLALISALLLLGARPHEHLLLVHGAGLITPGGRGLLLVAPGGSGKTTLAAALDAAGYGLLSDDVVPVTPDGDLLGLGLPICLKAGSWPVLAARRPDLAAAPVIQRFGEPVRLLPPCTPGPSTPVAPALLLLTRYQPGQATQTTPLDPTQALQGLLAAEAVLRDLTQAKLEALARWVTEMPAYRLTYPDLPSGLAAVQALVAQRIGGPCRRVVAAETALVGVALPQPRGLPG